jgi:hypothetical protein
MTWESAHIPPVAPAGPGGGNTGDGSQRAPQGAFVRRQRPYSGSQPGTCSRCFSGNQDATSRNAALATSLNFHVKAAVNEFNARIPWTGPYTVVPASPLLNIW